MRHKRKTIVLTGGPGAGKTAVLELVRQEFCAHVQVLPEAAGIVFGGGFPRAGSLEWRRGASARSSSCSVNWKAPARQRTRLSCCATVERSMGRRTGRDPKSFWDSVGTTLERELSRYDAVIHLRTPPIDGGYNHTNPLRVESAMAAAEIDAQLLKIWDGHPRRFVVPPSPDFLEKAVRTVEILKAEMPDCCKGKESIMRVLLAVDGSACSEMAVQTVIDRFRPDETQVKVLHAVEWMREMPLCFQYTHGPTAGDDVVECRNKSFERARELVERVAAQLEFKGFHPSVSTPDADPRHGIVEAAREWPADLIVMGSHGRRGLIGC